jgi:Family of unknown function (DUF6479)
MRSLSLELAARGHLVGIGPLVIGVVLVLALIVARVYYIRRKQQEPPPPADPQPRGGAWETPEEHGGPAAANHGPGHQDGPEPVGYENVRRDPEEVRPLDAEEAEETQGRPRRGGRRTPHQVRPWQGPRT